MRLRERERERESKEGKKKINKHGSTMDELWKVQKQKQKGKSRYKRQYKRHPAQL
jgi:hypothetical protein